MVFNLKRLVALGITIAACLAIAESLAVMSIDFGSEYFKVAIVKPGVPMEIALNSESHRKTKAVVSMKNGERLFSDPAMSVAVRHPAVAYQYLQDLLGKGLDNPVVKRYQERFPYYNLEEDPETKTVVFKHSEDETFTPEELIAMILEHAKFIATQFAEQPVTDAVITVPAYFNQAERRAMLRAADIAGVKVLQLMNDNTATALQYGIFRRKEFNSTATNFMFFDMGATSTSATVVSYQEVKEKNKVTGTLDKFPQVHIRGVGYNRNLGGLEFQLRLRDHLAKLFNAQKKTNNDVTQNKRSMAKLFKEAGRLKHVLSANVDHVSQIESLLDDQDFKAKVSRVELEQMCADLFDKVGQVVEDALKSSEFTMDEISEVILMGGSTRIPMVKENLQKAIGREEVGKSINTDEAAALGAVYQAAHLSKGFKVKKFGIKEATIFPIVVEFEKAKNADGSEPAKKMVTRTLFGRNNPYPQKKVMTFNKHVNDFDFEVNYGDVAFLNEEELKSFGSRDLQRISLQGVADAYGTHLEEAEPKGVKAHFKMEESGILELAQVEYVFERQPIPVEEAPEEKSTLEKIGSAFGSLFGGSDEKPEEDKDSSIEGTESKSKSEKESEKSPEEKETVVKDKTPQKETEKATEGKAGDDQQKETSDKAPEQDTKPEKEDKMPENEDKIPEKNDEQANTESVPPSDEKSSDDDKADEKTEETPDESTESKSEKEEEETGEKPKTSKKKNKKKDTEKYDTKADKKTNKTEKKEADKKPEKPKNVTLRADILHKSTHVDISDPTEEAIKASRKKIKDLQKRDEERILLAKAKNDLETFIIDTQDKLYQDDYVITSLESDRNDYGSKLSAASDWLYDQEDDTGKEPYIEKLEELKKMTKGLFARVRERQERPRAIEALRGMLNYSEHFLVSMKNFTGTEIGEQPFTQVEYDTLSKLITSTKEWNETVTAEQAQTPDTEKPKLTVEDIARKLNDLDREVKYLVNKAKTFRPKPPKTEEKKNATKTKSNDTKSDSSDKKTDSEKIIIDEDTTSRGTKTKDKQEEDIKLDEAPKEKEEGTGEPTGKGSTEGEEEEVLQLDKAGVNQDTNTREDSDTSRDRTQTSTDDQTGTTENTATHNPEEL